MDLRCLCCKSPVAEDRARLFVKVFVCPRCHDEAELFVKEVTQDLKDITHWFTSALQQGLRSGEFNPDTVRACDDAFDRLESLVRWVAKAKESQCPVATPSTQTTSLPTLPSGATTKPHVLSVIGSRSSPSSTP